MGWPPPPKPTWSFFETEWPPKKFPNKCNIKNIGTKSVNMSDIMVYLAMFSTTIVKILCFWVLIRWKWVIILLFFGTLRNLGLFFISEDPLILNFSQLKVGTSLIFWRPPPPSIWTVSQISPLFTLKSFPKHASIFGWFKHLIVKVGGSLQMWITAIWTSLSRIYKQIS